MSSMLEKRSGSHGIGLDGGVMGLRGERQADAALVWCRVGV